MDMTRGQWPIDLSNIIIKLYWLNNVIKCCNGAIDQHFLIEHSQCIAVL